MSLLKSVKKLRTTVNRKLELGHRVDVHELVKRLDNLIDAEHRRVDAFAKREYVKMLNETPDV